jgi:hypothetical protein
MSLRFNPNPEKSKYVSKAGVYVAKLLRFEAAYTQQAEYYAKLTFQTADGELVGGLLSTKADKSGNHSRLNDFMAGTATTAEIEEYLNAGDVEVDESFLEKILLRAKGRTLSVDVRSKTYKKKDGTEGTGFEAAFFARLPSGPQSDPF